MFYHLYFLITLPPVRNHENFLLWKFFFFFFGRYFRYWFSLLLYAPSRIYCRKGYSSPKGKSVYINKMVLTTTAFDCLLTRNIRTHFVDANLKFECVKREYILWAVFSVSNLIIVWISRDLIVHIHFIFYCHKANIWKPLFLGHVLYRTTIF